MSNEWEMPEHEKEQTKYYAKAREYFEKNADEIQAFASKYGLQIDKFTRGSSTWDLRAKHPKGGYFTIFIGLSDEESVRVSGGWDIDVFETFSKYWKTKNFIDHYVNEVKLTEWLEKAFREILSWKVEELKVAEKEGAFRNSWKNYKSKEDFEKAKKFWPQSYPKGYEPWVKSRDKK